MEPTQNNYLCLFTTMISYYKYWKYFW